MGGSLVDPSILPVFIRPTLKPKRLSESGKEEMARVENLTFSLRHFPATPLSRPSHHLALLFIFRWTIYSFFSPE